MADKRVTLQISGIDEQFKKDVEFLARSLGYFKTSDFLRVVVGEYVSLNRERISCYKKLTAMPFIKPTIQNEVTVDEPPLMNADNSSTSDERSETT